MRCRGHLSHCSNNFGSDSVTFTSSRNRFLVQERTQTKHCGIKSTYLAGTTTPKQLLHMHYAPFIYQRLSVGTSQERQEVMLPTPDMRH